MFRSRRDDPNQEDLDPFGGGGAAAAAALAAQRVAALNVLLGLAGGFFGQA